MGDVRVGATPPAARGMVSSEFLLVLLVLFLFFSSGELKNGQRAAVLCCGSRVRGVECGLSIHQAITSYMASSLAGNLFPIIFSASSSSSLGPGAPSGGGNDSQAFISKCDISIAPEADEEELLVTVSSMNIYQGVNSIVVMSPASGLGIHRPTPERRYAIKFSNCTRKDGWSGKPSPSYVFFRVPRAGEDRESFLAGHVHFNLLLHSNNTAGGLFAFVVMVIMLGVYTKFFYRMHPAPASPSFHHTQPKWSENKRSPRSFSNASCSLAANPKSFPKSATPNSCPESPLACIPSVLEKEKFGGESIALCVSEQTLVPPKISTMAVMTDADWRMVFDALYSSPNS